MNYSVFQETLSDRENGPYLTYGIRSEKGTVHDLSTNREAVVHLVDSLNEENPTETQLSDIIEDFLP